ncbi:ACT domain-containing protein ACR4 [Spatholobus suberectus]|nr:ACT domain-containing protein ACR4 [Spatholobus suberectus]
MNELMMMTLMRSKDQNVNVVNWSDKDYSVVTIQCKEYYIKLIDGSPVKSDAERPCVIQYLAALIERRVSERLKLELCTTDRVGLLSDAIGIFRENSVTVTREEVTTKGGKAVHTLYVRGAPGFLVDSKTIEFITLFASAITQMRLEDIRNISLMLVN